MFAYHDQIIGEFALEVKGGVRIDGAPGSIFIAFGLAENNIAGTVEESDSGVEIAVIGTTGFGFDEMEGAPSPSEIRGWARRSGFRCRD